MSGNAGEGAGKVRLVDSQSWLVSAGSRNQQAMSLLNINRIVLRVSSTKSLVKPRDVSRRRCLAEGGWAEA